MKWGYIDQQNRERMKNNLAANKIRANQDQEGWRPLELDFQAGPPTFLP